MIFAKVDVKLRDHIKAQRAGVAMATWAWALLYAREQETDGVIHPEALRGSWVGESVALKHAAKLVEVGLWEALDDGWRIYQYSAKNETREEIDRKRRTDRDRKRKSTPPEPPSGPSLDSERNPNGGGGESVDGFPGSGSGSGSGSESREGVQGEVGQAAPPEWWSGAVDTAAMTVGPIEDPAALWLQYDAARDRKGWARNHRDAVGWLSSVVRSERGRSVRRGGADRQAHVAETPPPARRDLTGYNP